ncbi:hypothetical protein HYH03_017686 [Edaphochlamys debaryana]|uniref:Uncharacterized protein n=1 Tax=Edaphochlamys debaryana TaxID=47281 RepID=A0A836BP17_9CHLO|nr:hypothetical protein HYH03_017686 [Edaphochlamys debaryana]|eukprot:KAG2483432.1 hypothetical protein HYH03_017686 [Edaphochlamys debaryana]
MKTVGSACLLSERLSNAWLLVAPRHCLDPQPGEPIGDLGLSAHGYKLRHLASFPDHDVSVLMFDGNPHLDPKLEKSVTPFLLDSGEGLRRGMRVTAAGFPQAVDKDIPGASLCDKVDKEVVSCGVISYLACDLDLAVGDYGGAMPNVSGGAVSLSEDLPGNLVGMHLGTVWHQEGTRPDGDDVQTQSDQPAGGTSGEGPSSSDRMEIERWGNSPAVNLLSSSGRMERRAGARPGAGAGGEGHQDRMSVIEAALKYCLDNVPHKGYLSYFVPAYTLQRLLRRALGSRSAEAGGGGGPAAGQQAGGSGHA